MAFVRHHLNPHDFDQWPQRVPVDEPFPSEQEKPGWMQSFFEWLPVRPSLKVAMAYVVRAWSGQFAEHATGRFPVENTKSTWYFQDTDGEAYSVTREVRHEFYVGYALQKEHIAKGLRTWVVIPEWVDAFPYVKGSRTVTMDTMKLGGGTIGSTRALRVKGYYEIEFQQDQGKAFIRRMNTQWRWIDDIDANDFTQLRKRKGWSLDGVLRGVGEGLVDLVADKGLGAEFTVAIEFTDNGTDLWGGDHVVFKRNLWERSLWDDLLRQPSPASGDSDGASPPPGK